MKRLTILFLCLLFATSTAFAGQESTAAPTKSKAKPKTVDCTMVDDARITADVKAKFAKSASLKDFTVNVATREGEVTITGAVKTGLQKGSATRMAKAVACVKKVVNQLTVEGASSKRAGK